MCSACRRRRGDVLHRAAAPRRDRYAGALGQQLGLDLVAEPAHRLRRRADEGDPDPRAQLGEGRVLGDEAPADPGGVRPGLAQRPLELGVVEVGRAGPGRAQRHGLVGDPDEGRPPLGLRVQGDHRDRPALLRASSRTARTSRTAGSPRLTTAMRSNRVLDTLCLPGRTRGPGGRAAWPPRSGPRGRPRPADRGVRGAARLQDLRRKGVEQTGAGETRRAGPVRQTGRRCAGPGRRSARSAARWSPPAGRRRPAARRRRRGTARAPARSRGRHAGGAAARAVPAQPLGAAAAHQRPHPPAAGQHGHLERRRPGLAALGLLDVRVVDELVPERLVGLVVAPGRQPRQRRQQRLDLLALRAEVGLGAGPVRVDRAPRPHQGGVLGAAQDRPRVDGGDRVRTALSASEAIAGGTVTYDASPRRSSSNSADTASKALSTSQTSGLSGESALPRACADERVVGPRVGQPRQVLVARPARAARARPRTSSGWGAPRAG